MIDRQELIALLDRMGAGFRRGEDDADTLAFRETLADAIEALQQEEGK